MSKKVVLAGRLFTTFSSDNLLFTGEEVEDLYWEFVFPDKDKRKLFEALISDLDTNPMAHKFNFIKITIENALNEQQKKDIEKKINPVEPFEEKKKRMIDYSKANVLRTESRVKKAEVYRMEELKSLEREKKYLKEWQEKTKEMEE